MAEKRQKPWKPPAYKPKYTRMELRGLGLGQEEMSRLPSRRNKAGEPLFPNQAVWKALLAKGKVARTNRKLQRATKRRDNR